MHIAFSNAFFMHIHFFPSLTISKLILSLLKILARIPLMCCNASKYC